MEYRDYYAILGVPRTATTDEIRKAFRKMARTHHPDRNPDDPGAEQRFKDVNEAHAVLSDPEKRKRYDLLGANWDRAQHAGGGDPFGPGGPFAGFAGGAGGAGTGPGGVRFEFRTAGDGGSGFSDFFRAFFGGGGRGPGAAGGASLEDLLGGLGGAGGFPGGGTATAARPRTRTALEAPADLTLEEAFAGTTRLLEVAGRRYEVKIPAGVDTGSRIRLSGRAPDGGDVVVVVRVHDHPVFARRGDDLEREVPLALGEALLGGEVPVGTLTGRVLLRIPAGTQAGRTFRLAGQGMPRRRGEGRGDLYVRTRTVLPTDLSDEARAAAERLVALAHQPDPRTA